MNLKFISLVSLWVLFVCAIGCTGQQAPKPRPQVEALPLEPLDFMTDLTHHQADLYEALKKNAQVETNKKTLAYEGALFRILQTSNGGKYGGAKRLINQYLEEYPEDPRLEFQMGMQLFRLGRFDQSQPYFTTVMKTRDKSLREAAQFFLAAAYSGYDTKESTTILHEIIQAKNHSFKSRAQAILDAK